MVGAGEATPEQVALAQEVGTLLAEQGHVVVCGGLGGVMEAAALGARVAGGVVVGLLPGLGDARNAAIKAIAQTGDDTVIAIQAFAGEPQDDRRESRPDFFDYRGAVRLYRSADLVEWHEVPHALPRDADPVTAMAVAKGRLYVGFENLSHGGLPVQVVPL